MFRHGRPEIRWTLTQAPDTEPISVADVRTHRKLYADDTSQDGMIGIMIPMAREFAEHHTSRAFVSQQWRATLDAFPGAGVLPTSHIAAAAWRPQHPLSPEILLDKGPLISVQAVSYIDINGDAQTLVADTDYIVDASGLVPRITPAPGKTWPVTQSRMAAVTIDVTVGYGTTANAVPAGLRHWLLVRVGTVFENREEVAILAKGKMELLPYIDGLLDPYKLPVI